MISLSSKPMTMVFTYGLFVMNCYFCFGTTDENSIPAGGDSKPSSRLLRLIELSGKKCTDERTWNLIKFSNGYNNLETTLDSGHIASIRICAIGHDSCIMQTLNIRADGIATLRMRDHSGKGIDLEFPAEKASIIRKQAEEIARIPVSFRESEVRGSSTSPVYILEVVDRNGYHWAIRPADDSSRGDYMAIVRLFDLICPINSKEWEKASRGLGGGVDMKTPPETHR